MARPPCGAHGGGCRLRPGGAQAAAALQQLTPQDEAVLYRGDHLSVQLGGPGERWGHEFIELELAQARDIWRARLAELTFTELKQRTLEHGAALEQAPRRELENNEGGGRRVIELAEMAAAFGVDEKVVEEAVNGPSAAFDLVDLILGAGGELTAGLLRHATVHP